MQRLNLWTAWFDYSIVCVISSLFLSCLDFGFSDFSVGCSWSIFVVFALCEGFSPFSSGLFKFFLHVSHNSLFSSSDACLQVINLCCLPHFGHLTGFQHLFAVLADGRLSRCQRYLFLLTRCLAPTFFIHNLWIKNAAPRKRYLMFLSIKFKLWIKRPYRNWHDCFQTHLYILRPSVLTPVIHFKQQPPTVKNNTINNIVIVIDHIIPIAPRIIPNRTQQ